VHATRVDLSDVSEQQYYALFCDRNRIYLCAKDNLAFFKGLWAEAPGALLVRGYSSVADAQVRIRLLLFLPVAAMQFEIVVIHSRPNSSYAKAVTIVIGSASS
jgi:hypothetical protein